MLYAICVKGKVRSLEIRVIRTSIKLLQPNEYFIDTCFNTIKYKWWIVMKPTGRWFTVLLHTMKWIYMVSGISWKYEVPAVSQELTYYQYFIKTIVPNNTITVQSFNELIHLCILSSELFNNLKSTELQTWAKIF